MVGEHLKGRRGGLQYEAGGEGADDQVHPGRNFLGASKDFLEPVTLPLVVAEDEAATPRGRDDTECGAQPCHVPLDGRGRAAGKLDPPAGGGGQVDAGESVQPLFRIGGREEKCVRGVRRIPLGREFLMEPGHIAPCPVELWPPFPSLLRVDG